MASFDFSRLTDGMMNLTDGYIEYAKEVIINRALPELRDGLKPVNRRILYTLYHKYKKGERVKSNTVVGDALKFHPHGDASVYSAMVLMVDRNNSMTLPVIEGQGNFGGVHTTAPAAASRYTEVKLSEYADAYFGDMNGIDMKPNYDSTASEPEVLPVSFPAILCNSTTGIAVGFRSNMPSFNFNDVLDLTMEYIKDGECKTVICPDFVTGGYYIKNNKELEKLMRTGKASLKLRGKVIANGKELTVVEFPYGKTIQGLQKQVEKANIAGVRDVGNVDDFDHGVGLLISCANKNIVQEVNLALYRDTDLQCNFSADCMAVLNETPIRLGVWGIVAEWVRWRREVVRKELQTVLDAYKAELKFPRSFIEVIKYPEKVQEITRRVVKESDDSAVEYILAEYDNEIIDRECAEWIIKRRLNEFRTGGKHLNRYNSLVESINLYEGYLADVDSVILTQLADLKAKWGSRFPRKTEITNLDYDFQVAETDEEKVIDTTECLYVVKNGFLKKHYSLAQNTQDIDADFCFTASASAILVAVDNRGRIIRIYCEDIPYSGSTEFGTYIPRYAGLDETDDYRIWWCGDIKDANKMIIYKDGNVGFFSLEGWEASARKIRVIEEGIAVSVADKVGAVIDVPEVLYAMNNKGQFGYILTENIKRKHRTAKTRVFNLKPGDYLTHYAAVTEDESSEMVFHLERYEAPKLNYLASPEDWCAEEEVFVPMYE